MCAVTTAENDVLLVLARGVVGVTTCAAGRLGGVSVTQLRALTVLRDEDVVAVLEQIVVQLSRAGFVRSIRGAQGGYQLSRPPAEYTVGDILRITEGSLAPVACLEHEPIECGRAGDCITLDFWRGLYKAINDYVDSVTLEDLITRGQALDFSI